MNDTTKQTCKNSFFWAKHFCPKASLNLGNYIRQGRGTLSSRLCMLLGSNAGITRFELYIDGHTKIIAHISYFFTGEEPYISQECETDLSRSRNLNRHERTHTGKKP